VGIEFRAVRRLVLRQAQMARSASRHEDAADARGSADALSTFSVEDSIAEFRELATSAGAEVVGEFIQRRDKADPATLVGSGKLQEIAGAAASARADLVLFDHDLSPSQQRNIEREIESRIIDRTQLILDIFARHARTREGHLQVELAQLEYMLPRLAGRGAEMSQLGGGIGTRGPGETQLETDRRKIHRRIRHVREQLEDVRRIRAQQRQRRESVPVSTVALVGYTNAGKSTLFNALTSAGVLESAKMFATLDPTIRAVSLPSKRKALMSDTVGFIRNLPHGLVTSFRATLEEVQRAALVVQTVDASAPDFVATEQRREVEKVLTELEAECKPRLTVLNKVDLLSAEQRRLLPTAPDILHVSAAQGEGLDALLAKIDEMLVTDPVVTAKLKVPQSEGKVLATVEAGSRIIKRTFRGGIVYLKVQAPESLVRRWQRFVVAE
jgi:GTP-binding protein HflX